MAGFFSKKKNKDNPTKAAKTKKGAVQPVTDAPQLLVKQKWDDAWMRTSVEVDEVAQLLHLVVLELKSKALEIPFLLLPFRPTSDITGARTFIRSFFDRSTYFHGEALAQELRLTEPMVLCSIAKWCWSRLPGGVVTWEAYELFKIGEQDSNEARDAFATFIPLSVDSDARTKVIFDFFDLLAAIAANAKSNGFGGYKLSRLAGWWAFEHSDQGNGFDGGYKTWAAAADATSHLFFAYLRSLTRESVRGFNAFSTLPMSLQKLVQETRYPPSSSSLLRNKTTKVAMIVDSVSPTPFALLRRTNHFQYRDEDRALQEFADYEDPVQALTEECQRVLRSISSTNQKRVSISKQNNGPQDASWSRFEDFGFSGAFDSNDSNEKTNYGGRRHQNGLRTTAATRNTNGRPTTPSWADFLSSGFVDESKNEPAPLLLPPDKQLPPIDTSRGRSSQSHAPRLESERDLEPGELANIVRIELDDAFWWVWISSLAGEETTARKAAFGRCALVETVIKGGRWLVMEEIVKGAAPEQPEGAYVAEKKSRFGWSMRSKNAKRQSGASKQDLHRSATLRPTPYISPHSVANSKTSIGPDQHARIQAAAAQLQQKQRDLDAAAPGPLRRGRIDAEATSQKTNSVFTLQPVIMSEASPAMQWANKYDKDAIKEAYLANNSSGRGLGQPPTPVSSQVSTQPPRQASNESSTRPAIQTAPQAPPMFSFGSQYLNAAVAASAKPSLQRELTEKSLPQAPAVPETATPAAVKQTPSYSKMPAQFPPTPPAEPDKRQLDLSDKAAETGLPTEPHPMQRNTVASDEAAAAVAPALEEPRPSAPSMPSAISTMSRDQQDKSSKLQKKSNAAAPAAGAGGLKKLFGRNKRQSVLPETMNGNVSSNGHMNRPVLQETMNGNANANANTNANGLKAPSIEKSQQHLSAPTINRRFSSFRKKNSNVPAADENAQGFVGAPPPPLKEAIIEPVPVPEPGQLRSYEPSIHSFSSRIDATDEQEANHEFSKFDQGPLEDNPAFVPDSPVGDSQADTVVETPFETPAEAPAEVTLAQYMESSNAERDGSSITKQISPVPVQDRWAQIRKNAAERAASKQTAMQSEDHGNSASSDRTDAEGETSGEETIESRVARIKRRVAEHTANMENGASRNGIASRY